MASSANAALCAVVAAVFWTGLGFAIARLLLPRALAIGMAPIAGWAIHSAFALPILTLTGFSAISVVSLAILAAIGGGFLLLVGGSKDEGKESIPVWAFVAAAVLALGVSGWEADIGLTWFTAFSSLMLMMGLSVWLGARASAATWVVVLSTAGSLRTVLGMLFGEEHLYTWLAPPIGLAGWLYQS